MPAETEPQPVVIDKKYVEKISQSLRSRCDEAEYPYNYSYGRNSIEEWCGSWDGGGSQVHFSERIVEPKGILALLRIRKPSRRIFIFRKTPPQEDFGFASIAIVLECVGDDVSLNACYAGDWLGLVEDPVRVNHPDDVKVLESIATDPFHNKVFDQDEV